MAKNRNQEFEPFRPWTSRKTTNYLQNKTVQFWSECSAKQIYMTEVLSKNEDIFHGLPNYYVNLRKLCSTMPTVQVGHFVTRPLRPIPLIPWSVFLSRMVDLLHLSQTRCSKTYFSMHRNYRRKFKRYPCIFCDMSFCNYGQLRSHIRSHTGEKPFICKYTSCERKFSRNEELTRHIRTHTGEKPFSCEKCGRRFARKDHMKKHYKSHDDDSPDTNVSPSKK